MVTDQQVRRLIMLIKTEKTKEIAAAKAGMDAKTARKYLKSGKMPSKSKPKHVWRTREDPFNEVWEYIRGYLKTNPELEAKTLFGLRNRGTQYLFLFLLTPCPSFLEIYLKKSF